MHVKIWEKNKSSEKSFFFISSLKGDGVKGFGSREQVKIGVEVVFEAHHVEDYTSR